MDNIPKISVPNPLVATENASNLNDFVKPDFYDPAAAWCTTTVCHSTLRAQICMARFATN